MRKSRQLMARNTLFWQRFEVILLEKEVILSKIALLLDKEQIIIRKHKEV